MPSDGMLKCNRYDLLRKARLRAIPAAHPSLTSNRYSYIISNKVAFAALVIGQAPNCYMEIKSLARLYGKEGIQQGRDVKKGLSTTGWKLPRAASASGEAPLRQAWSCRLLTCH